MEQSIASGIHADGPALALGDREGEYFGRKSWLLARRRPKFCYDSFQISDSIFRKEQTFVAV